MAGLGGADLGGDLDGEVADLGGDLDGEVAGLGAELDEEQADIDGDWKARWITWTVRWKSG